MIDADEWLAATKLTVFKNMYVEAGEPTDDAWHGDLGDLLLHYRGQACWSPYLTATPMRITADFEGEVTWTAFVGEVDAPKVGRPDPTHYRMVVDAIARAEGDGDILAPGPCHATKSGGTRIIWPLGEPRVATVEEYRLRWMALMRDFASALEPFDLADHGLHVDMAPKDASRLWRVPFFAVNRKDPASGEWGKEMDTYDRAFDVLSLRALTWADFRTATVDERSEAGIFGKAACEVPRLTLTGSLERRRKLAVAKLPRLAEFFSCRQPIPVNGTAGWNARFASALASVCRRLQGDVELVRALLDAMLDHIVALGGDRERWYRSRARSTLRWSGLLEEIERVRHV